MDYPKKVKCKEKETGIDAPNRSQDHNPGHHDDKDKSHKAKDFLFNSSQTGLWLTSQLGNSTENRRVTGSNDNTKSTTGDTVSPL